MSDISQPTEAQDAYQRGYRDGVANAVKALERYADDVDRVRAIGGEVPRISTLLADYLRKTL